MQRCEAFLVDLVNVGPALDELVHHHVLPVVAGHVEGCVAVCVGLVDLDVREETVFSHQNKQELESHFWLESSHFNPGQLQIVM